MHVPVSCPGSRCDHEYDYTRKSLNLLVCCVSREHTEKIIYDRMFRRTPPGEKVRIESREPLVCPKCGTEVWVLEMSSKQAERLDSAFNDARIYGYKEMFTEGEFQKRSKELEKPRRKPKLVYLDMEFPGFPAYTELVREINTCFDSDSYSATIVLVRKMVESLIVDLLRAMFGMANVDLFFLKSQHRFRNLSELIKNLREHIQQFEPYGLPKRSLQTIEKLREDGNANAHSVIDHSTRPELMELRPAAKKTIIALFTTLTNIHNSRK